jgi:hypothetical protein
MTILRGDDRKSRHSGAKDAPEASKRTKSALASIPDLFTLSPMPCIKGMVIWPLLA